MEQLLFNKRRHVEKTLSEVQFKFMHRIIVTKRKKNYYGIQSDDDCIYFGENDSIHYTFSNCVFVTKTSQQVISWFNVTNRTSFNQSMEEKLFAVTCEPFGKM